jgi:hypothetical protein
MPWRNFTVASLDCQCPRKQTSDVKVRSFSPSAKQDTTLRFITSIFLLFTLPSDPLLIGNTLTYCRLLQFRWFLSILDPACLGILIVDQLFCANLDHPVYYLDIAISSQNCFQIGRFERILSVHGQRFFTVTRANAPCYVNVIGFHMQHSIEIEHEMINSREISRNRARKLVQVTAKYVPGSRAKLSTWHGDYQHGKGTTAMST